MPRGTPAGAQSAQTQRLLDALAEIEERLKIERKRDTGRALLLRFVAKHQLTAADLRNAAKALVDRKVGDAPVVSKNIGKSQKLAVARKLREARVAKGLKGTQLGKMIGAKGTAAVAQWEKGLIPSKQQYRDGLIKHLDLPKDFFDAMPPSNQRGLRRKANGHAHG